jgi:hypothetical protein
MLAWSDDPCVTTERRGGTRRGSPGCGGTSAGDGTAERQHLDELGQDGADEALGTVSS